MSLLVQSIAIGLLLSILGAELLGLSAAGLIVSGYLAYYLDQPVQIAVIVLATSLTFLTEQIIQHITILYGRRLLALDVLLSFCYVAGIEKFLLMLGPPIAFMIDPIGYFIPALIVIYIGANGLFLTTISVALLTFVTRLLLILLHRCNVL